MAVLLLAPPDLSYQLLQEDAEYILTRLGINKLSVIGFSDGGIIGYRLALGNKVKITHLVAIAAGWHHETNPETIAMLKHITGPWWKKRHPEYFKKYHRLNLNGDFDLLVDKCVSMWLDQTASGYPDERIREIKCKLLLIRGDADFLIPLKSLTDIKSFLPQTQFLNIPCATHAVLEEKPEVCLKYIEQFLAAK